MALKLKAEKTFTDKSAVDHVEAFFGVYEAHFLPGVITLICGIWKDADSFLVYQPIINNILIAIHDQDYVDYFLTPIEVDSPLSPMDLMNQRFYNYLVNKTPALEGIDFADWELSFPEGVPATTGN